jgi:hypothetical protein
MKPYEVGVKISVATTLHRSKGRQFVACDGVPW